MAKSHVIVGIAGWIAVAPTMHLPPFGPVGLGMVVAGSLLPDVDHPESWVGRRTWPVSAVVSGVFGHRGVTHSAVAVAAAVAGLVAVLGWGGPSRAAVAGFAVGYLSHLGADMLSPRGLRLAWPSRRTWSVPVYTTGGASEAAVVAGLCALAGWVFLRGVDLHGMPGMARGWVDWLLPLVGRRRGGGGG